MSEQVTIQELYENINSSYTKEQINQLINLLSNNNNEDNVNKTNIKIRLLSYDEYDKYVKKSSLNGAISPGHLDTFHEYNQYMGVYEYNDYGRKIDVYPGRYLSAYGQSGYLCNSLDTLLLSYNTGNCTLRYTFDNIFSWIQNNNSNNCMLFYPVDISFEVFGQDDGKSDRAYRYDFEYVGRLQNKTTSYKSIRSSIYGEGNRYGLHRIYVNISCKFCWRPAFEYIDNRKSKNIDY